MLLAYRFHFKSWSDNGAELWTGYSGIFLVYAVDLITFSIMTIGGCDIYAMCLMLEDILTTITQVCNSTYLPLGQLPHLIQSSWANILRHDELYSVHELSFVCKIFVCWKMLIIVNFILSACSVFTFWFNWGLCLQKWMFLFTCKLLLLPVWGMFEVSTLDLGDCMSFWSTYFN